MRKYIHLIKLEKQKNRGGEILLKILNFKNVNLFLQNSIFMKVKDFSKFSNIFSKNFDFENFLFEKTDFEKTDFEKKISWPFFEN